MNQFEAALHFYRSHTPRILETPKNEWVGDAYAWSEFIRMTPIEESVWGHIRDANVVMYPQYPVGRFFVDFGNPVAKVAIECDGYAYHLDKEKDAERDMALSDLGWVVYRIPGYRCVEEFDEEAREAPAARQLIDEIGSHYGIRRSSGGEARPVGQSVFDLIDHLMKVNKP